MKKPTYDDYIHPEDKELDVTDIASHSSLLTNRRLDLMFLRLDQDRIEAYTNPCVPNLISYYAVISGIYNNIFAIFSIEENEYIKRFFDQYNFMFQKILDPSTKNKMSFCYQILSLLDQIQRSMVGCLQKQQYFFRVGRSQVRGINQALALYEKREKDEREKAEKKMAEEEKGTLSEHESEEKVTPVEKIGDKNEEVLLPIP